MQKSRALGVLLLVPILVFVAWLAFGSGGDEAPWIDPGAAAADSGGTAAPRRSGSMEELAAIEDAERSAIEASNPSVHVGASEVAIVGQVLDESGAALADVDVQVVPQADWESLTLEEQMDSSPQTLIARLRAMHAQRAETKTDAEGRFRLGARGKGPYVELIARLRGYSLGSQTVKRPIDQDVDVGTVTLRRGAIVSGRVVDRAGKPVAEAMVFRGDRGDGFYESVLGRSPEFFALTERGERALSDAEGRFEIAHVPAGDFSLRAVHVDHPVTRVDGLKVAPGATLADLVLVVEPGATIRGTLVGVPSGTKSLQVRAAPTRSRDANDQRGAIILDGQPVVFGDYVGEFGQSTGERIAEVAANGEFVLRGLVVGRSYTVWGSQDGRGFGISSDCSARVDVAAGTSGVELRYEHGVTVVFKAVDSVSRAPIEQLSVVERLADRTRNDAMYFPGPGPVLRTYPDGLVTLGNLRPKGKQRLSLVVEALGYLAQRRSDIELPAVGTIDLGIVELSPTPKITVRVHSADGTPLQGVTVSIAPRTPDTQPQQEPGFQPWGQDSPMRQARTDAAGLAVLNSIPGKSVILRAHRRQYAPYRSEDFTCPEHGDLERSVTMLRGGTVEVQVVELDGALAVGAQVEDRQPSGERNSGQTDKRGVAVFENLAPGEHWFGLSQRGGEAQWRFASAESKQGASETPKGYEKVEVVDGQKSVVTLQKPASARLVGVVRENGQPLAGARITFRQGVVDEAPKGNGREQLEMRMRQGPGVRSAADGAYRLNELTAGEHRLRISHRDRVMAIDVRVVLRDGENKFDIDLDTTILRGTVTDARGAPVADATISVATANAAAPSTTPTFVSNLSIEGMGPVQFGGDGASRSKTDAQGRYELRGVDPSTPLVVRAAAKGHTSGQSAPVQVARGSVTDGVDLTLGLAGRVTVRVTASEGPAMARATWAGDESRSIAPVNQALRGGQVTLDTLEPGPWRIVVNRNGTWTEPRQVEVIAGQTVELEF